MSALKFEISENVKAPIPEEKLTLLSEAFAQIDSNQDGKIELDEYLDFALAKEKTRLTKRFEAADSDKDECVEFEEFVATTEPTFQMLKQFRELDLDRNGLLKCSSTAGFGNAGRKSWSRRRAGNCL